MTYATPTSTLEEIYTVSELNQRARNLLEKNFGTVWVSGEISNLAQPASGHAYFTLKDDKAQVRCALFRGRKQRLTVNLAHGMQVRILAAVSLYEGRGDFQLIVDRLELAGEGPLQQAFEQLKKRLASEGLFEEQHKQALPELARAVGVVTSTTGAALRDILSVLKRRFASLPVIIYPTAVQGEAAAAQIVTALEQANQRCECDVIILARGGGSLEDLWPFNEETVARSVFASHIPIVTGIGHQTDFSIADFVADYRAPTPSAAAEACSPDKNTYLQYLAQQEHRLTTLIQYQLNQWKHHLQALQSQLKHPQHRLQQSMQRLDYLSTRLTQYMPQRLHAAHQQLQRSTQLLDALTPLATLNRGYSITFKNNKIVRDAKTLSSGDRLQLRFAKGEVAATVD